MSFFPASPAVSACSAPLAVEFFAGPISGDMYPALIELSSYVHLLPPEQSLTARRLLHGLFDCCRRTEGLEQLAVLDISGVLQKWGGAQ